MFCSKCGAVLVQGAVFCATCGTSTGTPGPRPAVPGGAPAAWSPAAAPSVRYAGFWLRFVAYLIDGLIVGIPIFVGVLLILAITGGALFHAARFPEDTEAVPFLAVLFTGGFLLIVVVALCGGWLYYAMSESSSWQGTLGKKALNLYVTDLAGQRVSFARASGRYFSKLITGLVPLGIGYIMAGFTEKKQALHDMIAGCLVLRRM